MSIYNQPTSQPITYTFASYTYLIDLIVSLHVERVKHDLTLHSIIHEKDVLAVDINMEYILDVSI